MRIEGYGVKGMRSIPWRREFKSRAALDRWVETHDAEVHGTRTVEAEPSGMDDGTQNPERGVAPATAEADRLKAIDDRLNLWFDLG
jgi:hypothetical protein